MNLFLTFLLTSCLLLKEKIPDAPFTYAGKSPREKILFDPENAPLFDAWLHTLTSKLFEGIQEEEILAITTKLVREEIFDRPNCTLETLNLTPSDEVPLESFLEKRIGVCRHFALTTTLLIDRLIKQGVLQGEVFFIRDETPFGRHGWTLFLSDKGAWHLDPYLGFFLNGEEEKEFLKLCRYYGKRTMETQKLRWTANAN